MRDLQANQLDHNMHQHAIYHPINAREPGSSVCVRGFRRQEEDVSCLVTEDGAPSLAHPSYSLKGAVTRHWGSQGGSGPSHQECVEG